MYFRIPVQLKIPVGIFELFKIKCSIYYATFNHSPLSWKPTVKYLRVMLCSNLFWSAHCKYASAKASKSLSFLRNTLWGDTTEAKSMTYKYLVRPSLKYASVMWSPHTVSDKATVESVQRRAA